jgi:PKD repeat protein
MYCGSDGGIFRSTNDGNTFQDLSSGLEISQFYRIGSFTDNSELILGGTQDNGTNLYSDGDWIHVYFNDGMESIIHPQDPEVMFCSYQYGAILKSEDGGQSFDWSASGITEDGAWVTPYIISGDDDNVMYAGYENVWKSENGGGNWSVISDLNSFQARSIAAGVSDPATIYVGSNTFLYKTNNGGDDWVNISFLLPDGITYIAVDPDDAERLWVSISGFDEGEKVYFSDNGGQTWSNISLNLPNVPVNCIVYNHESPAGVYVGTDIGVYHYNQDLAHWESFNENLPNVIITELEINYGDDKLIAATYGRGVWKSDLWQPPIDPPEAFASLSSLFICEGETITYTDASQGNAPLWSWEFEGGSPSESSEMNPVITYSSSGTYSYSLTVENEVGSVTLDCDGCVEVYPSAGEIVPVMEGFEAASVLGETDWYSTEDAFGNSWKVNSEVGHSGSHCAWIENYNLDIETSYDLISLPVDLSQLPSGENAFLSFFYAFSKTGTDNSDRLRLYISSDCGVNYGFRSQWSTDEIVSSNLTELPFIPSSTGDWNQIIYEVEQVDLSENVSFLLRFENGNGNNFFIDDINIWTGETAIEDLENVTLLSVYPVPAIEWIKLELWSKNDQILSVKIIDVTGKLVDQHSRRIISGTNTVDLDVGGLSKGFYLMKIGDALVRSFSKFSKHSCRVIRLSQTTTND